MRVRWALASLVLAGCNPDTSVRGDLDSAQQSIDELQRRVTAAEGDLARMSGRSHETAYLTPGDDGFAGISTTVGVLTVSLRDVRPYANGSRVILQIGNPTSATISRGSMQIAYGQTGENNLPSGSERDMALTLSEPLKAGAWSNVTANLEGLPPDQLGYVRVDSLETERISLTRPD